MCKSFNAFGIALDGLPIIGVLALATLVMAFLRWPWLAVFFLLATAFTVNFFRDPERIAPDGPGLAISPADGKVVKISEMEDPLTGETRTAVCIFMNVFNVHVNRVPVSGKISKIKYIEGKFINASFDKASTDNERNLIQITDGDGATWTVVQIAGLIARRIVCRAEVGEEYARGQRYGLIKFGSRVDVYLPRGYHPAVTIGRNVLAGQSVIAEKQD